MGRSLVFLNEQGKDNIRIGDVNDKEMHYLIMYNILSEYGTDGDATLYQRGTNAELDSGVRDMFVDLWECSVVTLDKDTDEAALFNAVLMAYRVRAWTDEDTEGGFIW